MIKGIAPVLLRRPFPPTLVFSSLRFSDFDRFILIIFDRFRVSTFRKLRIEMIAIDRVRTIG